MVFRIETKDPEKRWQSSYRATILGFLMVWMAIFAIGRSQKQLSSYFDVMTVQMQDTIAAITSIQSPITITDATSNQKHNDLPTLEELTPITISDTTSNQKHKGLPTLEELTAIPEHYECPNGTYVFRDIVLPRNVTHANRKIPKVVHITGKSRCVDTSLEAHILEWKFPDHSLYFHDDAAVLKLLEYAIHDEHGNEMVKDLSKAVLCISNGATMSDIWRYVLMYYYGGIYSDLDNRPGAEFKPELIEPEMDSFFVVEALGIMSQFWFASSQHHPIWLGSIRRAIEALLQTANVMINNPAKITGPGALKTGMIFFENGVNRKSNGYLKAGVYRGGIDENTTKLLPWWNWNENNQKHDYPSYEELHTNRSVTVIGTREHSQQYIIRGFDDKSKAWEAQNMTHYHAARKFYKRQGRLSCMQHVVRMERLVANESSHYYGKTSIADRLPNYKFEERGHGRTNGYVDIRTGESIVPENWDINAILWHEKGEFGS